MLNQGLEHWWMLRSTHGAMSGHECLWHCGTMLIMLMLLESKYFHKSWYWIDLYWAEWPNQSLCAGIVNVWHVNNVCNMFTISSHDMLTILHLDMLSTKVDLYTAKSQHYTILPDIRYTHYTSTGGCRKHSYVICLERSAW